MAKKLKPEQEFLIFMSVISAACIISFLLCYVFKINGKTEYKESNKQVLVDVVYDAEEKVLKNEPQTEEEKINEYVKDICKLYKHVEPELVMSIIWHESRYNPKAVSDNGTCVGLMQVSTFWHRTRAYELGVESFFDPESNILLGVDYLNELFEQYKDPVLVLMLYNMEHDTAFELYNQGKISYYAKSVLERAESIKNGGV